VALNLQFQHTTYKLNLFGNVWEETAAFISRVGENALSSVLDEAACFFRTLSYVQNYSVTLQMTVLFMVTNLGRTLCFIYSWNVQWNSCWHPSPYLWIAGYMDIQVLFLCKYFRHFNLCWSLALDIQNFFAALCHTVVWYIFLYFCLCFCVYIEIVALVWNSDANNMAGENVVKYTSRMWNIK
jgi:hypothetical protein